MTAVAASLCHTYRAYGVRIESDIPLPLPIASDSRDAIADVAFVEGRDRDFSAFPPLSTSSETFVCDHVSGFGTYLRWPRFYEFNVTDDGSKVACRPLQGCDASVFQNFLFGQVLAAALVRQGLEPLHAASVVVDDVAIAFLGDCAYGKSTLLASFAHAGYPALTDDMLIVTPRGSDLHAMPGFGRVKLMPDSAERFLHGDVGSRLTPLTDKRSFTLDGSRHEHISRPLRLLYILPTPGERDHARSIAIHSVPRVEVVRDVVKNTFSAHSLDRARLARQFEHAVVIASRVDVFRLQYPAGLDYVPAVREAIVDHTHRIVGTALSMTE